MPPRCQAQFVTCFCPHSDSWLTANSDSTHLLFRFTNAPCDDSFLFPGAEPTGSTHSRFRGRCHQVISPVAARSLDWHTKWKCSYVTEIYITCPFDKELIHRWTCGWLDKHPVCHIWNGPIRFLHSQRSSLVKVRCFLLVRGVTLVLRCPVASCIRWC